MLDARRGIIAAIAIGVLWLAGVGTGRADERFGPVGKPDGDFREQIWRIPLPHDGERTMIASVSRPRGEARHRLAIINHGSPANPQDRPSMRPGFKVATEWFVKHGYVVVRPMRRGYGETGGNWSENYGSCSQPNYKAAGLETAKDITAAIAYMKAQPFARPDGVVVVGQSAGGWGSLALAGLNPPEVAAIVNFGGGRGGYANKQPNNNCAPDRLVSAAGEYGRTARVPTLWIYTQNDLFFAPTISRGMYDAFTGEGGKG
jgi:dienelactone hydrolase